MRVGGVRVAAQAGAWPGAAAITREVTPLRIKIDNDSDHPLRIRYSERALADRNGTHYSALPPFSLRGRTLVSRADA